MIYFVADFFLDEVMGGAEACNEVIFESIAKDKQITKIKSEKINLDFLQKNINDNFLIANFRLLSEESKLFIQDKLKNKYIIIEHDHKYLTKSSPSEYPFFLIPEDNLINIEFYKNAKAVLAQSKLHSEVIQKNLLLENLVNLSGNCWTAEDIRVLRKKINNKKEIKYGILESNNPIKGMNNSIQYCKNKGLEYKLIKFQDYNNFIDELSRIETLIFFPQSLETLSRVAIEAKILGCKILTNKLLSVASEGFFQKNPEDILNYLEESSSRIPNIILDIFNGNTKYFLPKINFPKITLGLTIYDADKYIKKYMEDIVKQTIFNEIEMIIIDANSPGKESEIIEKYSEKYKNIKYDKLDYKATIGESFNKIIKESAGEYIIFVDADNFINHKTLEVFRKHLYFNKDIDLVYGDCAQVNEYGKTYSDIQNFSMKLSEHSKEDFSPENMIKCLPGPFAMWKKELCNKIGYFNDSYKYAMDWEMWLRMVKNGSKFKKINNFISGVYYFNLESGMSTSQKYEKERKREEAEIFFNYYDIFGAKGQNYIDYFWEYIK